MFLPRPQLEKNSTEPDMYSSQKHKTPSLRPIMWKENRRHIEDLENDPEHDVLDLL